MSGAADELSPALREFLLRRERLAQLLARAAEGAGDMLALMHCYNAMATWRRQLAPWEYIQCPACGGRGMWADGGNHWCGRCGGTGILPVCELTDADRTPPHRL